MTKLEALQDQEKHKNKRQYMTANVYVRTVCLRTDSNRIKRHQRVSYPKKAFLCNDIVVSHVVSSAFTLSQAMCLIFMHLIFLQGLLLSKSDTHNKIHDVQGTNKHF